MKSLAELLEQVEKLASERGWIGDNMTKFHPPERDKLLTLASFDNYKASIANLENRQHSLEHELALWVLAHVDDCLKLDSGEYGLARLPTVSLQTPDPTDVASLAEAVDGYYAKLKATKPEREIAAPFAIGDRVLLPDLRYAVVTSDPVINGIGWDTKLYRVRCEFDDVFIDVLGRDLRRA